MDPHKSDPQPTNVLHAVHTVVNLSYTPQRRVNMPALATESPPTSADRLSQSTTIIRTKTQRLGMVPTSWWRIRSSTSQIQTKDSPSDRTRTRTKRPFDVYELEDDDGPTFKNNKNLVLTPKITPFKKRGSSAGTPATLARPSSSWAVINTSKSASYTRTPRGPDTPMPMLPSDLPTHDSDVGRAGSDNFDEEMKEAEELREHEQVAFSDHNDGPPSETQDEIDITAQIFSEGAGRGMSTSPEREPSSDDEIDAQSLESSSLQTIRSSIKKPGFSTLSRDGSSDCVTPSSFVTASNHNLISQSHTSGYLTKPEDDQKYSFHSIIGHRSFGRDPNRFELQICWEKNEKEEDHSWIREEEIQLDAAGFYFQYWRSIGGRQKHVENPDLWYMFSVDRSQGKGKNREFLVSWLGSKEQSWEPLKNVEANAKELLKEFERKEKAKEALRGNRRKDSHKDVEAESADCNGPGRERGRLPKLKTEEEHSMVKRRGTQKVTKKRGRLSKKV